MFDGGCADYRVWHQGVARFCAARRRDSARLQTQGGQQRLLDKGKSELKRKKYWRWWLEFASPSLRTQDCLRSITPRSGDTQGPPGLADKHDVYAAMLRRVFVIDSTK